MISKLLTYLPYLLTYLLTYLSYLVRLKLDPSPCIPIQMPIISHSCHVKIHKRLVYKDN